MRGLVGWRTLVGKAIADHCDHLCYLGAVIIRNDESLSMIDKAERLATQRIWTTESLVHSLKCEQE